ncbi:MAG: hypothetical protein KAZ71_03425 [Bacteroidia bacterium]|nr:hypothetical protein [Bacteroidia bacterium]
MSSQELCYYCGKNHSDSKYAFKKMLYSKLDSEYGLGLLGIKKTTRYYEKEFSISRCETCFKEHNVSNGPTGIVGLFVLVFSSIVTYIFALRVYISVIVGIIAGIVGMVVFIQLTYRKKIKSLGIKDANEIHDYPIIKDLLSNGWQTYKP